VTAEDDGRPSRRGRSTPSHARLTSRQRRARSLTVLIGVAVLALVVGLVASSGRGPSGPAGSAAGKPTAREAVNSQTNPATAASPEGTPLDPTKFETGSCMAFSPTSPASDDRHETVFIDAGHGGIDPGAIGTTESGRTIHEADETLPVELDAAALLRAQGYRVVVSRTRASTVIRPGPGEVTPTTGTFTLTGERDDVAARDVCADMAKATILLAIYFDAGTSPTNAGSITGFDSDRPFSAENHRLAEDLQTDVLAHLNAHGWTIPDDGVVTDKTLGGPPLTTTAANYDHLMLLGPADPPWFTTPSEMPGALIEPLFITDPFEGTIANSQSGQHAIAAGMAEAAEQYLQGAASGHASTTGASTGAKAKAAAKAKAKAGAKR